MLARLETEQEELLSTLCEASRSRSERWSFLVVTSWQADILKHPGLPGGSLTTFHSPELEVLSDAGLLHVVSRDDGHVKSFDVSPAGFVQWEERERTKAP